MNGQDLSFWSSVTFEDTVLLEAFSKSPDVFTERCTHADFRYLCKRLLKITVYCKAPSSLKMSKTIYICLHCISVL